MAEEEKNEIVRLKAELQQAKDEKVILEERLKLLQEEFDKPVICNRCGSPAANRSPQLDPTVLQDYFRSILAQKPFSYTYKLLNGGLILKYSSQYGDDIRVLDRLLIDSIKQNRAVTDIQAEEVLFVTSLDSVQVYNADDTSLVTLYESNMDQKKEYAKNPELGLKAVTSKIDRITYQLVRRTFQKFAILCNALQQAAEDENFYKGVGLL